MIELFSKVLLRNLEKSISGYFFKRDSYYFDKKDKVKTNIISGIMKKIKPKYSKRFFKLDVDSCTFAYAKDEVSIANNPRAIISLRDIISVNKNVVSMPVESKDGEITFEERSIFEMTHEIDRGPNDRC